MAETERAFDEKRLVDAAKALQANRTGLVLSGRIKNGELQLDQSTLDQIRQQYPDADVAFVALNSPFDAESQAV